MAIAIRRQIRVNDDLDIMLIVQESSSLAIYISMFSIIDCCWLQLWLVYDPFRILMYLFASILFNWKLALSWLLFCLALWCVSFGTETTLCVPKRYNLLLNNDIWVHVAHAFQTSIACRGYVYICFNVSIVSLYNSNVLSWYNSVIFIMKTLYFLQWMLL